MPGGTGSRRERRSLTLAEADAIIRADTVEIDATSALREPVVSVRVISFNQAEFVAKALDGALTQITDFPVEIVVGDDASSDGTTEIVVDYQKRHPDRIRVLLAKSNLGRITGNARLNFLRTLRACRGSYVALLDADDYWINPRKLQIQVDLLERERTATLCFHWARWLEQQTGAFAPNLYGPATTKSSYSLDDLLEHHNFLPTSSVVARRGVVAALPEWWLNVAVADYPFHLLHAQQGPLAFVDEAMSVYRYHSGGMHSGLRSSAKWEQVLDSIDVPARNLGLSRRPSYRRGVAATYVDLARAYAAEERYGAALNAGVRALSKTRGDNLIEITKRIAQALPGSGRVAAYARRTLRVAKRR